MIGSYRVTRYIGKGGMGHVYEAVHDVVGQRAAVKFVSSDAELPADYFQRFENEARAASAVQHPGLVKVFDFGRTPEGEAYLLMEYLEGEVLRARIDRLTALPLEMATRFARQLASALAAVHGQGVVHRDVKPENIIIVADDAADGGERAKLLDFGIAHLDTGEQSALSQPGVVLGTPMYMSPEQLTGRVAGPSSDIYSLGVVVWEMLRGVTPFGRQGAGAMLVQGVTSPYLRSSDVPVALAELVEKMLANDTGRRPTAPDVATELELRSDRRSGAGSLSPMAATQSSVLLAGAHGLETTAPRPHGARARVRRLAIALASGAAVVASVALGIHSYRRAHPAAPQVALNDMIAFQAGTFTMGRTPDEVAAECAHLGTRCRRELLDREQPARRVTLESFYIDITEVTNTDVAAFLNIAPNFRVDPDPDTRERWLVVDELSGMLMMNLSSAHSGVVLDGDRFSAKVGFENRPAVQVTWDGARAFCATRGKRLPTEAEWEFAARGTTARRFPWGDNEPQCDEVVFGVDPLGPCKDMAPGVHDVASAPLDRTPEGVIGMGGNVSEWVEDAFTLPYYPDCGDCRNPKVDSVTNPEADLRVFRGAGWNTSLFARTTSRGRWNRMLPAYGIGFRCAANGPR